MKTGKLITYGIIGFIVIYSTYTAYGMLNQDCKANPPMVVSCGSTNLIDNGYTDCKLTQHAEKNIIFPDKIEEYNCEYNGARIQTQLERTKCSYTSSNLTADYRFCS